MASERERQERAVPGFVDTLLRLSADDRLTDAEQEALAAAHMVCLNSPQQDTEPESGVYPRASVKIYPDRVVVRPLLDPGEIVVRRAASDAEPVEGELPDPDWAKVSHAAYVAVEYLLGKPRTEIPERDKSILAEAMKATVHEVYRQLRARVQPRKVSESELRAAFDHESGRTGRVAILTWPAFGRACKRLGLQIEGGDDQ